MSVDSSRSWNRTTTYRTTYHSPLPYDVVPLPYRTFYGYHTVALVVRTVRRTTTKMIYNTAPSVNLAESFLLLCKIEY
jgi:hypothetical protein